MRRWAAIGPPFLRWRWPLAPVARPRTVGRMFDLQVTPGKWLRQSGWALYIWTWRCRSVAIQIRVAVRDESTGSSARPASSIEIGTEEIGICRSLVSFCKMQKDRRRGVGGHYTGHPQFQEREFVRGISRPWNMGARKGRRWTWQQACGSPATAGMYSGPARLWMCWARASDFRSAELSSSMTPSGYYLAGGARDNAGKKTLGQWTIRGGAEPLLLKRHASSMQPRGLSPHRQVIMTAGPFNHACSANLDGNTGSINTSARAEWGASTWRPILEPHAL